MGVRKRGNYTCILYMYMQYLYAATCTITYWYIILSSKDYILYNLYVLKSFLAVLPHSYILMSFLGEAMPACMLFFIALYHFLCPFFKA